MTLPAYFFSSVHGDILIFLLQSFEHENSQSVKIINLQSLYLLILTFFFSRSLLSCIAVLSFCICTPCISEAFLNLSKLFFKFCLGK